MTQEQAETARGRPVYELDMPQQYMEECEAYMDRLEAALDKALGDLTRIGLCSDCPGEYVIDDLKELRP